ncbi:2-dehydro-3-deoxygalactonokinase [Porifericola rhodea]|uniref:2-dehydro-3-deoxygalactonokinase n=1 Tax=Porifericola rhodea TaxID=930972 RepID=UPI0026668549|nr:2-dehydro-3-deoxygalactonokinase [Porifericola rhodea]WKN31153.1 2-dehydro-3-deoxygalactonokinase [Porifericola rhodea]
MNPFFISCDWGTSSFRLSLINTNKLEIIHSLTDSQLGFGQQSAGKEDYIRLLDEKIELLCRKAQLDTTPLCILSGMASSSIGIKNLPYAQLPLAMKRFEIPYEKLESLSSDVFMFSGLCTDIDVMRGEEVQVLGAYDENSSKENQLLILPGTHSKHVLIQKKQLTTFTTYMTGELFALLQNYSILKHSVQKPESENGPDQKVFLKGVEEGKSQLLKHLFGIRARQILQKTTPEMNYAFLSGLLIGNELYPLSDDLPDQLTLCADGNLGLLYKLALQHLFPHTKLDIISTQKATIAGHFKLLQGLNHA